MEVFDGKDVASAPGGGHFTGRVWLDPILDKGGPDALRQYRVCFEPGARTNWHTHPGGQSLVILTGNARAGAEGQPVRALSPGDVVYSPPGEWHWHGAGPHGYMIHVATNPGGKTEWGEDRAVTDEEYAAPAEVPPEVPGP